MSKLAWYWHRLRAMSPAEVASHVRKKWRASADAKRRMWRVVDLAETGAFPRLPKPEDAPVVLREALKRDADNILAGRWKFFGHLELQVDDPPKWQYDYLVCRDVETMASGFDLDYRVLGNGMDSKVIWEPSRWHQLTRLAMAAHVLRDRRAREKCIEWLEDWVKHNPPYRGWNWTSALEVGMRLVQFSWMDALLSGFVKGEVGPPSPRPSPPGEGETSSALDESVQLGSSSAERGKLPLPGGEGLGEAERKHQWMERIERLRLEILPPHVWYAWRHKSFGSSANNHLIGELAGLILATVRWPALAQWGAPLDELQRRWEREVLEQFAEDGGNKEQALNYHLFSWEFCWQARMALVGSERKISPEVDERLRRAAQFFVDMQVPSDPWDYGDSDSAFVTPLFADGTGVLAEWHEWFRHPAKEQALEYWMGSDRRNSGFGVSDLKEGEWRRLEASGYAVRKEGDWTMRWDLSALGLGSMAAHGHLDALHLSLWCKGVALLIDPGTGAYYGDKELRNWLASRTAHNVPTPGGEDWPARLGPFLWADTHDPALFDGGVPMQRSPCHKAELVTKATSLGRIVACEAGRFSLKVEDWVENLRADWADAATAFSVRWQFAPASQVERLAERRFRVARHGVSLEVQVSADWAEVFCVTEQSQATQADPEAPLAGIVSPAFRSTVWAPYLKLVARLQGDKPCVFTTTFLAYIE